jgi:DNA-binding transcriptional ArsR family regulator
MLMGLAMTTQEPAIEVAAGLRFEVFYALHGVLAGQRAWTPSADLLALHEELGGWPEVWLGFVDLPGALATNAGFEEVVERFAAVTADDLVTTILVGMVHNRQVAEAMAEGRMTPEAAIGFLPATKRQWLAHVGLFPFDHAKPAGRLVDRLLSDPEKVRELALDALDLFWRDWFEGFWRANEEGYRAAARDMARDLGGGDLEAAIAINRLPVEIDHSSGELCALRGGYRTPITALSEVRLAPSAFNTGRFWDVLEVDGEQIACFLVHRPSLCTWESEAQADRSVDLALVCRALGNSSRIAIADLLAERPRAATEIAETLGLSKSTVSHHLFLMREAGLIDEELTASRSIILTLRRQAFLGLPNAAMRRFFSRDGT